MRSTTARRLRLAALLAATLCLEATAAARDPLDSDDPPRESTTYRPGTLGLGFTFNPLFFISPTNGLGLGPTAKVFLPRPIPVAFQLSLGFGAIGLGGFGTQLDALYEAPRIHEASAYSVNWYAGLGGNLGVAAFTCTREPCGSAVFGGHAVLGLAWLLNTAPLEFVAEWRPGVLVIRTPLFNQVGADLLSISFAGRYFF